MKKRLSKLCSLTNGVSVADIGCDHGYLCEMLIEKNFNNIYACEITNNNLNKAKQNIINYVSRKFNNVNLDQNVLTFQNRKVEFVLSNGFDNLQIVPDCAIIAGMGGELIIDILFKDLNKLPNIVVLQPMSRIEQLRSKLIEQYEIIEDEILFDCGKFYNIIKARRGRDNLSDLEIKFGRTNLQNLTPEFKEYLTKIKSIAKGIKTKQYEDLLIQIEKVEEMYEQNIRIPKN